jgi:3-methyl-2-oxobutanoate hydroxymethyltransferase
MEKITTKTFAEMKKKGEKIAILTCYEFSFAKMLNLAGIDALLVGDSLGMVKLGYENTLPVTIDDILYHTKAVKRGNSRALLIADMPFMSYESSIDEAVSNAGKLVKLGGAEAVKIEGGKEIAKKVRSIVEAKIPVMGHIGLTPQSINQIGGYKVQGRDSLTAKKLVSSAKAIEKAGAFALVLECVPSELAKHITQEINIPTIGIGAGIHTDGQVLVTDDLIGLYSEFKPKFVKRYINLKPQLVSAFEEYIKEVKNRSFPSEENSY